MNITVFGRTLSMSMVYNVNLSQSLVEKTEEIFVRIPSKLAARVPKNPSKEAKINKMLLGGS